MSRMVLAWVLFLAGCASVTPAHRSPPTQELPSAIELDERDDATGAFAAYLALLDGPARKDPALAALALDRLDAIVADGRAGDDAGARLARVEATALPQEVRHVLALVRARALRLVGDDDGARVLEQQAGCGLPWGGGVPLGHLARLDLARPLGDEAFAGSARAPTRGRGCRVLAVTPDARPGALPIALDVTLPQAATIELLVGGEAPYRVWADRTAGPTPDERTPAIKRRGYRIALPAGRHRLAVVVASTHGRSELELTVLGPSGARYDAPGSTVGTGAVTISEIASRPVRDGGALDDYLAAADAARSGDVARMRAATDRLERAPGSMPALALAARIAAEDPTVPSRLARDRARRLFERALARDPRAARVRYELGRLALDRDRARDALELAEAAPDRRVPRNALLLAEALRARNRDGEVRAVLEAAGPAAQRGCAFVESLISDERARHRPVDLDRARRAALCRPGSTALGEALRQRGDLEGAIAEYRRVTRIDPAAEGARAQLAEALSVRGRVEEAIVVHRDLVDTARRSATYRLHLVDALVAAGRATEAKEALAEGLRLEPESAELIAAERALAGEGGAPYDLDRISGRDVIREFEGRRTAYEGAAVFLLDRTVTRVYSTGAQRTITHNIVRVLAKEGIDRWGEWTIPEGAELLTLCAWKPDGRRLEPEEIPEKESISLPGLSVGDYVEVEYVERAPTPAAFPGGFLAERFYFGSFDAALDRSEYVLVTPRGWTVELDTRGVPPQQSMVERDEPNGPVEVRRFVAQKVEQAIAEPGSSPAAEFMHSVRASARVGAPAWRDYLTELAWGTRRRDAAIEARATQLVAGARDDRERLTRLDRWVRGHIKQGGSVEESATAILARREGNRATILAALAEAAGLRTRLLLARPLRAPQIPIDLEGYDVLLVEAAGIIDDPRQRHGLPGELPPLLRGASALPLEVGAPLVTLPKGSSDLRRMKVKMALQPDGSGRVQIEEHLTGWPAVEWRDSLAALPRDRVRPQFEQRTLAHFFPGASLGGLRWEGEEDDDKPFIVRYDLTAPGLARRLGDAFVLPAPFAASLLRRYATGAARQSPIYTDEVAETDLELEVELPEGTSAQAAPPVASEGATGRFAQDVSIVGSRVRLRSRFFMPTQRIAPTEAARFLGWAETVDRAEAAAVRLVPRLSGTAGSR